MSSSNKLGFETTRFGRLEVEVDRIIHFPEGLLGFPGLKRYLLLDYKDTSIQWLQAIDDPDIAFIVVDPLELFPEFSLTIDNVTRKALQLGEDEEFGVLLIIRVDNGNVIANVSGPLIFNVNLMKGAQIVNDKA